MRAGPRLLADDGLVILPQALRVTLPDIVNNFIGLFKDTTLFRRRIFDFCAPSRLRAPTRNGRRRMFTITGYALAALFYFVCCFGMSRYAEAWKHEWPRAGRR